MAYTELDRLLDEIEHTQPGMKARIQHEISRHNQKFGLIFEHHLPETVQLPGRAISNQDIVQILPERGSTEPVDPTLWKVDHINSRTDTATLIICDDNADDAHPQTTTAQLDDLVAVALNRDKIYPGLHLDARVSHPDAAPDAPVHAVINAENSHALKMLTYTHYHSIDCIYIDPPYNTGARDWKYNNNYVDGDDAYRHSKWLTFMERRLKLAKKLLNPENSVLIVTIDEKEVHRLALLLEQVFPEARIQMVSSVINPKGALRSKAFSRVDEYLFFVFIGDASGPTRLTHDMLNDIDESENSKSVGWVGLRRRGSGWQRENSPGCFYPVYVDPNTGRISEVGEALPKNEHEAPERDGMIALLPYNSKGQEARWQLSPESLKLLIPGGFVKVEKTKRGASPYSITYLSTGQREQLSRGEIVEIARDADGSLIVEHAGAKIVDPKTVWNTPSHNADTGGTKIISKLLGETRFTYPKSLYAVEDALRFFVKDKPDAVILDFFAGSGTTAHAVMRLNQEDDGRRQSISITNNEVSDDEAKALTAQRLRPKDDAWSALGIANHVTYPRVKAAITGNTAVSDYTQPIKGKYAYNREAPMADGISAHAALFTLTYENPLLIQHDMAFDKIAPLLWLRAGQRGEIITADMLQQQWAVTPYYGVIQDQAQASRFVAALAQSHSTVTTVFIITDDALLFQSTAQAVAKVNPAIDTVQMYSTYLDNFTFQDN